MCSIWATVGQGSMLTALLVARLRSTLTRRYRWDRDQETVRAHVGVRVMEGIECPLRLDRDGEHLFVEFAHLDPKPPHSLPPEQPHLRPVRGALGELTPA